MSDLESCVSSRETSPESSEPAKKKKKTVASERAMKMSKVGNQTNSQDPQAVNSRVFVGNLNTFQCSKTDVERMFQRYGRIAGISMHKGYAFVQFTNPFDARSACLGEDGRTVLGQTLDVNMVAEPKPHQTGRKRQNVAKTGNDWDYYYDSYYASASFPPGPPRLVPPLKRPRLMAPPARPVIKAAIPQKPQPTPMNQLKTYSNPDILICGNCREMFTELQELLDHKKTYCKLRFTCKCHTLNGVKTKSPGEDLSSSAMLLCVLCKDSFQSAWDLMVHVQAAHMMNIYELGIPKSETTHKSEQTSQQTSPANSPCPIHDKEVETKKMRVREGTPNPEDEDAVELSCDDILASPEMDKTKDHQNDMDETHHDKELEELMAVESTAQACIMHALRIEQTSDTNQNSGSVTSDQPSVMVSITNGELSAQE
ncbi:uncharacterized protein [Periplaneta americana]